MLEADLLTTVRTFLDGTRTASLATADAGGDPHAANVQFVRDVGEKLDLFWVSSPDSEHSRNLAVRPDAALAVYGHDDAAGNIHGLQLRGRAVVVPPADAWGSCWDLYTRKYPVAITLPQIREKIDGGEQLFYRFSPTWLRWIDNRRGFGWKREITLRSTG